jgi:hypothetical protein
MAKDAIVRVRLVVVCAMIGAVALCDDRMFFGGGYRLLGDSFVVFSVVGFMLSAWHGGVRPGLARRGGVAARTPSAR